MFRDFGGGRASIRGNIPWMNSWVVSVEGGWWWWREAVPLGWTEMEPGKSIWVPDNGVV